MQVSGESGMNYAFKNFGYEVEVGDRTIACEIFDGHVMFLK